MGEALAGGGLVTRSVAAFRAFFFVLVLLLAAASCKKAKPKPVEEPAATAPVVTDTTEGLLFAWIDDKGEFHIVEKTTDVPIAGRDAVRVMDPTNYDTSPPDRVFVGDLRVAGSDGSYPVRTTTREELDAIALARRAK